MSDDTCVETLFKEHSSEEIESVRDNLAEEIVKRTELLKSIVKEKYCDVVGTSDAIQSMKLNLAKVEQSIQNLDNIIKEFFNRIKEPIATPVAVPNLHNKNEFKSIPSALINGDESISQLIDQISEIWEHFDSGNLGVSIKCQDRAMEVFKQVRHKTRNGAETEELVLTNIETNLNRARDVLKNHLLFRIQSAEPNQIGIIAGSDEKDLYLLSLRSSIDFLVDKFGNDISDTSYQAQIRRFQPSTYFNTRTNQVDPEINDLNLPATGYARIPKSISIELNTFLYDVCRVINTIAGFNLTRSSILASLKLVLERILDVYSRLVPSLDDLKAETKQKRAMQLYFDMTYIRVLLNMSKHLELIEELESDVIDLIGKFELLLDTIELYAVSETLHDNVLKFNLSTMRLYGLLIPYLK